MFRNIPQDDNFSPVESPMHNSNKNSSSSSTHRVVTTGTTTTRAAGRLSYQELLDGSDIYRQVGREGGADPPLSPSQQLEVHVESPRTMEGSSKGHGTSVGSVGATNELSASEDQEGEYREPGLLGSDGVLAMPHVKMILLLGCINSVRRETTHHCWPTTLTPSPRKT